MKVIQVYINNPLRNFNYILYSEKAQQAIVFDPTDLSLIDSALKDYSFPPKILINTHRHHDHIKDNKKFLARAGNKHIELKDGEKFHLSESEYILCRFTPGHVAEHFCYFLVEDDKTIGVITGDTVFNAGVGNCRDGGDPITLFKTIKDYFITLADDVLIYPSHDYFLNNLAFSKNVDPSNKSVIDYQNKIEKLALEKKFYLSSIGEEKKYNPFFRVFDKDFQSIYSMNAQDLFVDLRLKRDKW